MRILKWIAWFVQLDLFVFVWLIQCTWAFSFFLSFLRQNISKIKYIICCIIFRSNKINPLYDLRKPKVLDSNMFIFIQQNNIVKNHQLMSAFILFYFSYSLNVRWQKPGLKVKIKISKIIIIRFKANLNHVCK